MGAKFPHRFPYSLCMTYTASPHPSKAQSKCIVCESARVQQQFMCYILRHFLSFAFGVWPKCQTHWTARQILPLTRPQRMESCTASFWTTIVWLWGDTAKQRFYEGDCPFLYPLRARICCCQFQMRFSWYPNPPPFTAPHYHNGIEPRTEECRESDEVKYRKSRP